ncbi:hypothetical protein GCM10027521_61160 [Amycolatopsis cihanbeyliensis]
MLDEPMPRTWMQDSVPPSTSYEERPGRWVGEPASPSPHVRTVSHGLAAHRILPPSAAASPEREQQELSVESPLSVGQLAGKWCSYNAPPDLPYDQREEDGGSLVFETDTLAEKHGVLGAPAVDLEFTVDRPVTMVAARLSDVAPDGRATRVTYGLLNLTHRADDAEPEELEPGRRYRARITLNGVAQTFPPSHRIRLSLSTSYWPLAWPPPRPVRLTVFPGASTLSLPMRAVADSDEVAPRPFDEPEGAPPLRVTELQPGRQRWNVVRDLIDYHSALHVIKDSGTVLLDDIGLEVTQNAEEIYSSVGEDFTSVRGEVTWTTGFRRDGWNARAVTRTDPDLHGRGVPNPRPARRVRGRYAGAVPQLGRHGTP